MEEESKEKVSWNLGKPIVMEIASLSYAANAHYLAGRLYPWFNTLRAMKMRISPKLSPEEKKELRIQEGKIVSNNHNRNLQGYSIEIYNEMIFDLLKTYGFYPKDLEDSTSLN